jgi:signal transduction histidine kinase
MERRFLELEQAKRDVDQKVEARTAELRLAGGKLAESLARLEQLSRVKDEFLANVSHELRTPLTLILGPLEDLLVDADEPRRADLTLVQRNAVRLNGMVDDLLDLARLQAGQLHLTVTTFELGDALERVVEQFRPLAGRRGLTLTLVVEPVAPLEGDPRRLEFVFANLLSNALKFTPAGGAVRVAIAPDGGNAGGIAVSVADTGPGIPPELQEHIFGRFNRYDIPGAAGAAGSGIGLALVKELVELHHGSVAVASEPGQGACFTVRLPRAQPAGARVARDVPVPSRRWGLEALSAPLEQPLPPPSPPAPLEASAPRVLVVEDRADMRAFIAGVLGRRYAVVAVAGADEALAEVAQRRCDAVVSDVMMPGRSGYELCRALKEAAPTTPVLLLTARKASEWALHGFAAGADDYLAKPFHPDELLARVDVQLRLRALMDEAVQREKLATLGQLAAGLAHEVRNPVSAILAGLPRLQRDLEAGQLRPGTREMVDVAIDCAERISALVGDLLALGEPDRDGPRRLRPHEGLEAAVRVLRHRAPAGVELRCRFDFSGEVVARGSALNQVFVNLVDNAIAAVGERGLVEVRTRAGDDGVIITVDDSGAGVPESLRARIFDPFFTTKAPGAGTGLGLHVSRRIVHEHGGTLELVPSTLGGACFRIWLPA